MRLTKALITKIYSLIFVTALLVLGLMAAEQTVLAASCLLISFFAAYGMYQIEALQQRQDTMSRDLIKLRKDLADLQETTAISKKDIEENALRAMPKDTSTSPDPALLAALSYKPKAESPKAQKPQKNKPPASSAQTQDHGEDLSDTVVRELLHRAVKEDALDVFMQPIVRLPGREPKFYELFSRIRARPGIYLPASRYMKLAQEDAVMDDIDNLLLMRCISMISEHGENGTPYFMNVTQSTIKDARFMKGLIAFLGKQRHLAGRLVFEMSQKNYNALDAKSLQVITGLAKLGCSFSLDHVTDIPENIAALHEKSVRFVKLDSENLLGAKRDSRAFQRIKKLKRVLEANGIGVIIEKIETEDSLLELEDYNINYGQGHYFGRPDIDVIYTGE